MKEKKTPKVTILSGYILKPQQEEKKNETPNSPNNKTKWTKTLNNHEINPKPNKTNEGIGPGCRGQCTLGDKSRSRGGA